MSTLENWAQDKLSVFLGFDSNTIRSQVWPYVMATKTPEAFCERLMDMVGTNEEALAFIEEFTNRRFYPEKIQNTTPASLPPTHSSKPLKELFPDLPSTQFNQETLWPANFNVHNKKEEEYIASLKKAKKKTKSTSNNELRAAAILTDKPKQEKKKKKEMSLETALKELNIQSDTKKRKPCSCQATKHPLLTVAPNCLNCGKIICTVEGVGPCMFCGSPVISEEQEASLIAEAKKKRAEQNLPQKREELPNQSVGYASRVNGDLFSQYYVFDPNKMKLDQNKSNQESNVRKVMVIDNQSKKVRMESIEAPSSSEDDDDDDDDEEQYSSQHAPKQGGDGTFAGFYAYNPLLKDKAKPKFIKKKVKSKTKKNESKAQTA